MSNNRSFTRGCFYSLLAIILSACGGSGGSGDNLVQVDAGTDEPVFIDRPPFSISADGAFGLEILSTLSVSSDDPAEEYTWAVVSQPSGTELSLDVLDLGQTATLVPFEYGDYLLEIKSELSGVVEYYGFNVGEKFDYDITKVENYDPDEDPSTYSGVILNQFWVQSSILGREGLEEFVSSYGDLVIVGFDNFRGLLIQIDEADIRDSIVGDLKSEDFIDYVDPNVHYGRFSASSDMDFGPSSLPDDFNIRAGFPEDSWHLRSNGFGSDIVGAWEVTNGHTSVGVTVIEPAGFWLRHEDIEGRFYGTNLTSADEVGYLSWGQREDTFDQQEVSSEQFADGFDHGTAVAGIVGAATGNGKGIAGINPTSQMYLVFARGDLVDDDVFDVPYVLYRDAKAKVFNYSFTETSTSLPADSLKMALDKTRVWRRFAEDGVDCGFSFCRPDVLHVFSGGNLGVDSRQQNGAIQYHTDDVDGFEVFSPLKNVIVVGAISITGNYELNHGRAIELYAPHRYRVPYLYATEIEGEFRDNEYLPPTRAAGTSFAAPIVSGVASLIHSVARSYNYNFTAEKVKQILLDSVRDHDGRKVLNAKAALEMAEADILDLVDLGLPPTMTVKPSKKHPVVGESIQFLVEGPILPDEMSFRLGSNDCDRNFQIPGGAGSSVIFDCGRIESSRNVLGFAVRSSDGTKILKRGSIGILGTDRPEVRNLQIETTERGFFSFTVNGSNLPDDISMRLEGEACGIRVDVPEKRLFSCPIDASNPQTLELVVSAGSVPYPSYFVRVVAATVGGASASGGNEELATTDNSSAFFTSITPNFAMVGERIELEFMGENLNSPLALRMSGAADCSITVTSSTQAIGECTPLEVGASSLVVTDSLTGRLIAGSNVDIEVLGNETEEPEDNSAVPFITSVSPLRATVNERTEFTFVGENLHSNTFASLAGADGCTVEFRSSRVVIATCTPRELGRRVIILTNGNLVLPIPGSRVDIEVVEPEPSGPEVTSVTPLTATVGEEITFEIFGSNLRSARRFSLSGTEVCDGVQSKSETKYTYRCVPETAGTQLLSILGENLGNVEGSPVEINIAPAPANQPLVLSVTPDTVVVGEAVTFELTGADFPSTMVSRFQTSGVCDTNVISSTRATLRCTLSVEGEHQLTVKKSINGLEIGGNPFTVSVLPAPDVPEPSVTSISPSSAIVGAPVTIAIIGENLPDTLAVFLTGTGFCDQTFVTDTNAELICIPEVAGSMNLGVYVGENQPPSLGLIVMEIAEAQVAAPQISSVTPLTATVGEELDFVITGSNLPTTLTASLAGASDCAIESRSVTRLVVECTPGVSGTQGLSVLSNGSDIAGSPVSINVSPAPIPDPIISNVSPQTATVGEELDFVITGSNLPTTLTASLAGASDCAIESRSSTRLVVECTPGVSGTQNLSVLSNGSDIAGSPLSINVSPAPIPDPVINSISPLAATVGDEVDFLLTGSNLPSTLAVSLEGSSSCVIESSNSSQAVVSCVPQVPGSQSFYVAAEAGGTALAGTPMTIIVSPAPSVTSITPTQVTEGETVEYIVVGEGFPKDALVFIDHTSQCSLISSSDTRIVIECIVSESPVGTRLTQQVLVGPNDSGEGREVTTTVLGLPSNFYDDLFENGRLIITLDKPDPVIFSASPLIATVGTRVDFTLMGTNLPSTLAVSLEGTSNCAIESLVNSQVVVSCTPQVAGSQSLYVAAEAGGTSISGSPFIINVSPRAVPAVVSSVTPTTVTEGETVRFEIAGSNFPEDVAVAIQSTHDCVWVSGSESQVLVECTIDTAERGRPIIRVRVGPNNANAGGAVFDSSNTPFITGVEEFSGSPISFVAVDVPVISSVSPLVATVGEEAVFTISGTDLFNTTSVTLGESVSCFYIAESEFQLVARCVPTVAGMQSLTVDGGEIAIAVTSPSISVLPAPLPDPELNSVSPVVATVGEQVDFVLTGSNFPSTLVVSLEGTSNCVIESLSSTRVVVSCAPQEAGTKNLSVATEVGGPPVIGTPIAVTVSLPIPNQVINSYDVIENADVQGVDVILDGEFIGNELLSFSSGMSCATVRRTSSELRYLCQGVSPGTVEFTLTGDSGVVQGSPFDIEISGDTSGGGDTSSIADSLSVDELDWGITEAITILGDGLEQVTEVTIDGGSCNIVDATDNSLDVTCKVDDPNIRDTGALFTVIDPSTSAAMDGTPVDLYISPYGNNIESVSPLVIETNGPGTTAQFVIEGGFGNSVQVLMSNDSTSYFCDVIEDTISRVVAECLIDPQFDMLQVRAGGVDLNGSPFSLTIN